MRNASGTWLPCTVCNGARHNHMPDYSPGCVANRLTKPTHSGCEDRGGRLSGFSTARRDHRESAAKYIRPVMPWWCFLRRARTSPCSNADTVSPGRGHTSLWHGAEGRRVASNAHACCLQGFALQMLRPICIGSYKHIFWATQVEFFRPGRVKITTIRYVPSCSSPPGPPPSMLVCAACANCRTTLERYVIAKTVAVTSTLTWGGEGG